MRFAMSTRPSSKQRICTAPRESQAARADRAGQIVRILAETYPVAECALRHASAFELLAATILSAQCTDERVNLVTPHLFQKFPTPQALAAAKQADVEKIIQSTGFFRAKATSLRGMAQGIVERFGGEIPKQLADLITLPGVGRKTANVVLGTAFGIPSGVVVDTHVTRITRLLALTKNSDAVKIEQDLIRLLPESEWSTFRIGSFIMPPDVHRPTTKCTECPLLAVCPRVGLPALESSLP